MTAIYFDESGNTGDITDISSFIEQPYFSLVAVDLGEPFYRFLNENLAKDQELKSVKMFKRNKGEYNNKKLELMYSIVKELKKSKSNVFIEVADKKFQLIYSLCNGFIHPPYYSNFELSSEANTFFASFLHKHLSDTVVKNYAEYCTKENRSKKDYFSLVEDIQRFLKVFYLCNSDKNDEAAEFHNFGMECIDKTIEDLNDLINEVGEDKAISLLSPLSDCSKYDKKIHILPHVTCFTHLIGRINQYYGDEIDNVQLIHDTQVQYDTILLSTVTQLGSESVKGFKSKYANYYCKLSVEFNDSKKHLGIQIADLLSGFMTRFFCNYAINNINELEVEIFKEIISNTKFGSGANFVIPRYIMKKMQDEGLLTFHDLKFESEHLAVVVCDN